MAARLGSTPRNLRPGSIPFVLDGESEPVALTAPAPVRRSGRSMVHLVDLWVASGLPGDVIDLAFEIVPPGSTVPAARVEGLDFARGFLVLATRELWWERRRDLPSGLCVGSVVVRAPVMEAAHPAMPATVAPLTADMPSPLAALARVLPHATASFPAVRWRWLFDRAAG
jgi:hypothetical protein